jgi:hypothetical protein
MQIDGENEISVLAKLGICAPDSCTLSQSDQHY